MRDSKDNNLEIGDYIIVAAKASISHVMKLGKVHKIENDKLYFYALENDWRGLRVSKRLISLEREELNTRVIKLKRGVLPPALKSLIDKKPIEINSYELDKDSDFFNNEIEFNQEYIIAKYKSNTSKLEIATLIQRKENGELVFRQETTQGGTRILRSKKNNRIIKAEYCLGA